MNNRQRAERAAKALKAFSLYEQDEATMRDLICDLRHWSDLNEADWAEEYRVAMNYYEAEVQSEAFYTCDRCGKIMDLDWYPVTVTTAVNTDAGGNCTDCGDDLCSDCSKGFDEDGRCRKCRDGDLKKVAEMLEGNHADGTKIAEALGLLYSVIKRNES